jgi:hypothetical protein
MSRLLDQVRKGTWRPSFSSRTEGADVLWIKRAVLFHGKCHPPERDELLVRSCFAYRAVHTGIGASTQNQALNDLRFL